MRIAKSVVAYAAAAGLFSGACGSAPPATPESASDETSVGTTESSPTSMAETARPRTFSLGFTPFPHDATSAAIDEAYDAIGADGDLFAFHTTEGVAWTEALAGRGVEGYGAHLRDRWESHRSQTSANPSHEVYLGLTPLDDSRSHIADYWGERDHMPVPEAFRGLTFDSPEVVDAYVHFVREAVAWYEPDYLAIGLEANLLQINDPAAWPAFASLMRQTYSAVKSTHPDLPVFITVTGVDLLEGWTDADHIAQLAALDDILAASDYLALSMYPFMSVHLTDRLPSDPFERLAALAGDRPLAIAETGYPAQLTELPSFGLMFDGTEDKQAGWIDAVLTAADTHEMAFVVNFVSRDYDALWSAIDGGDLFAIWRDTGLWDENGAGRVALDRWRTALARPRS